MLYLASPYSDPSEEVRERRFEQAALATSLLMSSGFHVFSPIAHSHPIEEASKQEGAIKLPSGTPYWLTVDKWYMERCDNLVVLMLSGWDKSHGVAAEEDYFEGEGKPVIYAALNWVSPAEKFRINSGRLDNDYRGKWVVAFKTRAESDNMRNQKSRRASFATSS